MENKKYLKPLLTLVFIAPFLTELLSGNLPPSLFFQPHVFLGTIIVYGLAVLIIRELAVKWELGIEGLFVLGIAYGIYNEGVCAKTLLMAKNVPIDAYDGYKLLFGINFAWAILIVVWHSLHSIIYPILIVAYIYPYAHKSSWLNRKWAVLFTALVVSMGIFMFFANPGFRAAVIYLPAFVTIITFLVFLSKLVPKALALDLPLQPASLRSAFLGFCFFSYIFGSIILAAIKVPIFFLCIYAVLIIFVFYEVLKHKKHLSLQALVLFALGNIMADALFSLLGGVVKGSSEIVIMSFIFILVFTIAILKTAGKIGCIHLRSKGIV